MPAGFGPLWSTVVIDLIGFGMVLPILPLYARQFRISPFGAASLVAAYAGASLVCSPLWGRLSDRVGRKPVLLVSLVGTAAGSLLTGLAGGFVLLLVGRLVDGGSGASVAVAQASAADLAGPGQRPRLVGLLGAAFGVGFVAGPALAGLATFGGARVPFFAAAGLAGVNAVVASRRLTETHRRPSDDHRGAPARTALQGARLAVPSLLAVSFLAITAFSAFEATFSVFAGRHLSLGLGSTAAVFAAIGVLLVGVQGGLARRVVGAVGERAALGVGLALNAVGLAMLAPARTWWLVAPALAVLTVGEGLAQVSATSYLAGLAGGARRGRILGWQQSANGAARVAGPVLGGALLGSAVSGSPYVAGAALTGGAFALLLVLAGGALLPASEEQPAPAAAAQVTVE